MNNRKHILLLLAVLVTGLMAMGYDAVDKTMAKNILLKTNRAIGVAHIVTKKTKNYTGKLAKAVSHERLAKKLYNNGNYLRAIHHSRRARLYAADIMNTNKAKPTSDMSFSPQEEQAFGALPSDKELDDELAKEDSSVLVSKDEDLMNGNLGIDVQ